MVRALNGVKDLSSLHIISHGSQGALYLGTTVLESVNLASYSEHLARVGSALNQSGDILLYGCNVARGELGENFVMELAAATRADVAASSDATGSEAVGGNVVLEVATGIISTHSLALSEISGLLAANTAPTFSSRVGKLTTDIGPYHDAAICMTLQADGKILLAGYSTKNGRTNPTNEIALVRYNSDGSLDSSFSGDGKATTAIGPYSYAQHVAVLDNGKILLAVGGNVTALVRYNSNGSIDSSFGVEGVLSPAIQFYTGIIDSMTLQADGKILVAGTRYNDRTSEYEFSLVRYNSDGNLDSSFSDDGILATATGALWSGANSVELQTDGKILLAGSSYDSGSYKTYFQLVRYNSDGSLDSSFSGDGKLTTAIGKETDIGRSVTLQGDGKILLAGSSKQYSNGIYNNDFALVRYNSDGSLDSSFSGDGIQTTDIVLDSADSALSLRLQADDKILLFGNSSGNYSSGNFALVRYNNDGSLDSSFSGDGKVTTDIGANTRDSANSIAIQADGRIVLAGVVSYSEYSSGNGDFALVRYNSDGSLDAQFGDVVSRLDGNPTYTGYGSVVLDADVQINDAELQTANNYSGTTLTLQRHDAANISDVFTAQTGGTLSALTSGHFFSVGGVTIGRVVSNGSGTLQLGFNSSATQALVSAAMQQIAYENTASLPSAKAQIDWTFSDGNTGSQGSGGALAATGSTLVNITARNVAPVLTQPLADVNISQSQMFSHVLPANAFSDANPDTTLTYSIAMYDNTVLPAWLAFDPVTRTLSGNPGALGIFDVNNFVIKVTARDFSGASESDVFLLSVASSPINGTNGNSPPTGSILLTANTAPTFLTRDGKLTTNIGPYQDAATSMTLQADGKILLAGYSVKNGSSLNPTNDIALARYNIDGSLDNSFSSDGKLTTATGSYSSAQNVAVQADGKILVAVLRDVNAIVRYNSDGSLDSSFGVDGVLSPAIQFYSGFTNSMTLQADGKILLAGDRSDSSGIKFALMRYNTDGQLDSSYGNGGTLTTAIRPPYGGVKSMALQADDKILVAGTRYNDRTSEYEFSLVRYNSDGSLDSSFSGDGMLNTPTGAFWDFATSVNLQADGKILLAGKSTQKSIGGSNDDFALLRYNSDGSLDSSFSEDGKLTTDFGSAVSVNGDAAFGVRQQADGKILLNGYSSGGGSKSNFALARYNIDGSLDSSFSGDGKVTTDIGANTSDRANTMTLQADGKILLAGMVSYSEYSSGNGDFALVRYNSDGSRDVMFGDIDSQLDGNPTYIGNGPVVLDADVQINDVELLTTNNFSGTTLTLQRHDAAYVSDVFTAKTGGTLSALTSGNFFSVGGVTIGRVVGNGSGTLQLGFNSNATQALVSTAMQQIAYENTAILPPGQAQIDWTFSDGNTGSQGSGGALAATGSTLVNITARNVAPVLAQPLADVSVSPSLPFSHMLPANAFTDANPDTTLTYTIAMFDNTVLPTWLAFDPISRTLSGNPGALGIFDINVFAIKVTALDFSGASASDVFRLSVASSSPTNGTNGNVSPTGSLLMNGTATQGKTLTASNALTDVDGIPKSGFGAIAYQWKVGGANIIGATASTYTLNQAEVGKAITVTASYTDLQGTDESVTSAAAVVANINDAPTGNVNITGTATQGQPLTASNTLTDVDGIPVSGIGAISYQWRTGGAPIANATGSTYVLTQAEVGKVITVTASYSDSYGAAESKTSSATTSVANINDAPTGSVTITGTATQGQTLTVGNTLADIDGIPSSGAGALGYQWLADGVNINGATASTFTLTQAQVGKFISVRASYTDLLGTAESVTSAPIKINTPPVARDNSYTITEDDTLVLGNVISDGDVLEEADQPLIRDTDADGDALSISAVTLGGVLTAWADLPNSTDPVDLTDAQAGQPWKTLTLLNGTAWLKANGELRYAGNAHETLGDTLGYTITDGQGGSASAQVQIKVLPVDDPTSANLSISGSAKTGGSLSLSVSNITDPDGTPSLAYQWQWLNDQTWQNIEGATSNTWAIPTSGLWAERAVRAQLSTTDPMGGKSVFQSDAQTIEASSQLVLGAAHWKTGKALPGVGLGLFDGATELKTGSDGTLIAQGFQDPDGVDDGQTVLNPSLAINPKQASITLTDVLGALKVYLGKPLPEAYNNDLKFIAADFDGNGTVNLTDVLGLLKFYLNKPVNAAPAWVFVDSAQSTTINGQTAHWSSKAGQTLSTTSSAPSPILADLNSDETVQLLGVLRGDVDGSWTG